MSIKRSFILSFVAIAFLLVANSCKKCTVAEENTETGIIVKGAIIYPKSGYITQNISSNHITGTNNSYASSFEVSFDGGATRVPVDFNTYDVLASPMTIYCKASFVKDVTLDNINSIVTYKVTATTCSKCENKRFVENYVLVPKIASGTTVWFDPVIIEN